MPIYEAGQPVRLLKDMRSIKSPLAGHCTIIRVMPSDGGSPRYRIRHDAEAFERVVGEHQLAGLKEDRP